MHASMHFSHNNNTTQCTVHIAHTAITITTTHFPKLFLEKQKNIYSRKKDTKYICMFFLLVSIQVSRQKNPFRNLRHTSNIKKHTRQAGTGSFLERKKERKGGDGMMSSSR